MIFLSCVLHFLIWYAIASYFNDLIGGFWKILLLGPIGLAYQGIRYFKTMMEEIEENIKSLKD